MDIKADTPTPFQKVAIEQFIAKLAIHFCGLGIFEIEEALNKSLRDLADIADANACFLVIFNDDVTSMKCIHEWKRTSCTANNPWAEERSCEDFPWLMQEMLVHQVVMVPQVAALPPEASTERDDFESYDLSSLALASLGFGHRTLGFIGFFNDGPTEAWNPNVAALLKKTAPLFRNILRRKKVRAASITRLNALERAVKSSEYRFGSIMESMAEGLIISDSEGRVTYANSRFAEIMGYSQQELLGRSVTDIHFADNPDTEFADEQKKLMAQRYKDRTQGISEVFTLEVARRDGEKRWLQIHSSPLREPGGSIVGVVEINSDITEQKKLEAQVQWSQKMDAVGKLAGSFAHDFNNLLTVVNGYSKLLVRGLKEDDSLTKYASAINKAGNAAELLTQRLLALSRRQVSSPRDVSVDEIIEHSYEILQGLVGKDISLERSLCKSSFSIRVDPSQLQQVLMNLVINAKEASSKGDTIVVESFEDLSSPALPQMGFRVKDAGEGMDSETQARVFEPFFTTKEKNNSGLGLATVYGIVTQNNGQISVESKKGVGTVFTVQFPAKEIASTPIASPPVTMELPQCEETVLIVEDEQVVRELLEEVLINNQFKVKSVANASLALEELAKNNDIALVLTDIVMPGMNGFELSEIIRKEYRDIKVIMMSGCTQDSTIPKNIAKKKIPFLPKPVCTDSLVWKIRDVLDSNSVEEDEDENQESKNRVI